MCRRLSSPTPAPSPGNTGVIRRLLLLLEPFALILQALHLRSIRRRIHLEVVDAPRQFADSPVAVSTSSTAHGSTVSRSSWSFEEQRVYDVCVCVCVCVCLRARV